MTLSQNAYFKLGRYKHLQEIDEKLSEITRHHINVIMQGIGWRNRALHASSRIAGSTTEGGMTARIFYPNQKHGGKINKEIETDVELVYCEFPIECKNRIEDIEGKPGYLRMRFDEKTLNLIEKKEHRKKAREAMTEDGYISSNKLKKTFCEHSMYDGTVLQLIMCAALNLDPDNVEFKKSSDTLTKASVETSVAMYIDEEYKGSASWDVVISVKIPWWPSVAQEWVTRHRKWPKKDVIAELTQHGFMITKSSDEEMENDDTIENRYSFSHVEIQLTEKYSRQQKLVYLVFKSMIYRWLKPIDPDRVSSFLGKTIMCWMVEENPPEDSYWDEDDETLLFIVRTMFQRLLDALLKGILQYYFIPSINIIEKMPQQLKMNLIDKVMEILEDTESYLPENIEAVIEFAEFFRDAAKKTHSFAEEYFQKDIKAFLDKPKLYKLIVEVLAKKMKKDCEYVGKRVLDGFVGDQSWLHDKEEVEIAYEDFNFKFEVPRAAVNFANALFKGFDSLED